MLTVLLLYCCLSSCMTITRDLDFQGMLGIALVVHISVHATCTSRLFLFILELSYKSSVLHLWMCAYSVSWCEQSFTLIDIDHSYLRLLDTLPRSIPLYCACLENAIRVLCMHTCISLCCTMAIHHIYSDVPSLRSFVVVACVWGYKATCHKIQVVIKNYY